MKRSFSVLTAFVAMFVLSGLAFAQNDSTRTTTAITYPLDQTIEVPFHGTTRLPRLKGLAEVKRQGRRGTRVQLAIDNLPRGYELGGVYTTFVLWAISPDGHVTTRSSTEWASPSPKRIRLASVDAKLVPA